MSDPVLLCRHTYPAGGRCLGPEGAERHEQPPPSHILPPFGHVYVPGVLVPWPPNYEAGAEVFVAILGGRLDPEGDGSDVEAVQTIVGAALGVDDDH